MCQSKVSMRSQRGFHHFPKTHLSSVYLRHLSEGKFNCDVLSRSRRMPQKYQSVCVCVCVLMRFLSRQWPLTILWSWCWTGADSAHIAQLVVSSDLGGGSRLSATSPNSSSNSVNAGRRKDSTLDRRRGDKNNFNKWDQQYGWVYLALTYLHT